MRPVSVSFAFCTPTWNASHQPALPVIAPPASLPPACIEIISSSSRGPTSSAKARLFQRSRFVIA